MLHLETVAPATLTLAQRILSLPELAGVRLVGGTALALQLGHRTSVDLDFFEEAKATIREAVRAYAR